MIDNMLAHLTARELLNKAAGCRGYAITPTSCPGGVAPPIAKAFASGWPSVELQARHQTPRRKISLFAYSESGKQLTRHEDDNGSAEIFSNENPFSTLTIEPNGKNTRRIVVAISIDAPLEKLWSVLTDYEGLANFLPGLAVCKVEDRWETGARLFQVQSLSLSMRTRVLGSTSSF
ncbi:hypothetical protein L7F22_030622 [Adiantum nelumboides]|nr:hypothetical protein [Adiantum nelumboides]